MISAKEINRLQDILWSDFNLFVKPQRVEMLVQQGIIPAKATSPEVKQRLPAIQGFLKGLECQRDTEAQLIGSSAKKGALHHRDAIANVRSEYFAALAGEDPEVIGLRQLLPRGKLLKPGQVQDWIEGFPQGVGVGEHLRYFQLDGTVAARRLGASPELNALAFIASRLQSRFHWSQPQAVNFVLTGKPPQIGRIRWTLKYDSAKAPVQTPKGKGKEVQRDCVMVKQARLQLEIDFTVQPNELRDWLRRESPFRGARVRPPSKEAFRLFAFLLKRNGPTRKASAADVEAWLRKNPRSKINSASRMNTSRSRVVDFLRMPPESVQANIEKLRHRSLK
jgi:hypothetical protein